MNISDVIEARRSVKNFDPEHIMPEEDLAELIRLTKLAPSSFNMQNYRLLVVRDMEIRKQIRNVAWDQAHVTDSSVLFILCADLKAHQEDGSRYWSHAPQEVQDIIGPMIKPFYEGNERLIRDEAIRSTGLAGMTLMLAAKGLGYDSCPMIGFDSEKVAELIKLPPHYALSFMIPVGMKTQNSWDRGPRLSDDIVVSYDKF
ncbi:nitroreductase family protein [Opitutales bacterium]|jgi:nitroreductase|nr:nitroreductase family protein [Opitutales bacterium]